MLVVSPNPSFKLFTSLIGDNLNRVVHASDTHPFLRQLIDHGQSLASLLDNFMPATTIHVEDDRIGVAENGLVLRPTIEHKLDLDGRARFFQTIGENLNAGIELMHPGWVRRLARYQHNLLWAGILRVRAGTGLKLAQAK